jgi:hypothetical protein
MRRAATAKVALIVGVGLVIHAAAAEPGPPSGFRHLAWGDPPSASMRTLSLTTAGMEVFIDRNDEGPARLVVGRRAGLINYLFYRKQFCRAEVAWAGALGDEEYDKFAAVLTREWGAADQTSTSTPVGPNNQVFRSHHWLSSDGETEAILGGIDDSKTPARDYLLTLTVQHKECFRQAADGIGLWSGPQRKKQ